MPRSVNHVASRARRKNLKRTRGYWGRNKNVWTVAKNRWEKVNSMHFATVELKEALDLFGFNVLMQEFVL